MMKSFRNLPAALLVVLLAACLFAYYFTRESAGPAASQSASAAEQPLVDTSQLQGAVKMASFAATADEQVQAREAVRTAALASSADVAVENSRRLQEDSDSSWRAWHAADRHRLRNQHLPVQHASEMRHVFGGKTRDPFRRQVLGS